VQTYLGVGVCALKVSVHGKAEADFANHSIGIYATPARDPKGFIYYYLSYETRVYTPSC
jgi:hypothetical protein